MLSLIATLLALALFVAAYLLEYKPELTPVSSLPVDSIDRAAVSVMLAVMGVACIVIGVFLL
ncbi:hypothetical protein [Salinisphaera sp.]|uniref:hypothetical protein n=1 Tax=Salinisphaera sp. TaxID=1914330 RepID=UPI000C4080F6|nr:hypothetical protein [Salinisphaera sp.]MAS09911.1 hypothetical protein [Salinisphaera sp.]MAS09966.1 hypothetical protein [Salinisphaera sp.]|tara:strand:+ start:24863 stop:25048 length:186 start_codon:yes stop_codon:yes gene_type:complete